MPDALQMQVLWHAVQPRKFKSKTERKVMSEAIAVRVIQRRHVAIGQRYRELRPRHPNVRTSELIATTEAWKVRTSWMDYEFECEGGCSFVFNPFSLAAVEVEASVPTHAEQ